MWTAPRRLIGVACWTLLTLGSAVASDPVPAPWTPVTLKTNGSATAVSVWGRTHRFDASPLPASIQSAGQELLAAPIRLVGRAGGKPLTWQRHGLMVFRRGADQTVLTGWLANDDVIADATVRVEFDGLMRVDLVLVPQRNSKAKLEQLWLEVPMKSERATLYHYWPGGWGHANNSGVVAAQGMNMTFRPWFWLGWEAGGLGWFAESDKGWQPQKADHAVEVVRDGAQTVLRLRLLDSPPPRLPLTFTFGFQASPVKPWPKDFHEWRIWHAPQLATTLAKSASVVFPKWFTCHRAFPDGKPLPKLARAAELGVKTVVFHEDWNPVQNYPATSEEAEIKSLVDACHGHGMKVLVYFGYEISSLAPEWAEMSDSVLVKDTKGVAHPGWHRLPEQRDFHVCYHSRYQDLLVDGIRRLLDRPGIDGVYLDGTIQPWGCANEAHGCGWRDAQGQLHRTYPIFAVRRLMQRLYTMIHPRGGLVNAHQSTCCLTPTLAFVHSYWDGEQFAGGELSGDPLSKLPLGAFRAEFMGKNFGVPCEFLAYERPPKWMFDDALAFTMLHDVRVRPHGSGRLLEQMSKIWDVMTQFGVSEAQWHPYWNNAKLVTTEPDAVKVSLYARPSRALLVVANLSNAEAKAAAVQVDSSQLGLSASAKAVDVLSGESLPFDHGRLQLPLAPMRMRMVRLE
jgi:hypothetical protein